MRVFTITCFFMQLSRCFVAADVSDEDVKVTQYAGPTECDRRSKKGDQLVMHYTGTIDQSSKTGEKGKQFDSSRPRGQTFDFKLGAGQVIRGWDEGLLNLCKGAKATLVISPDYGYGARGAGGDIPGGATLNFDVEVVDIQDGPVERPQPNIFAKIDGKGKDGKEDGVLTVEELTAFFKDQDRELPPGLMEHEDKDKDGKVSWEEFSGPKGDSPPSHEEL